MKINFPLPTDGKRHRYCQNCHSESVKDVIIRDKRYYHCNNCQQTYDRLIDLDPAIKWWIDKKSNEYFHESVGIMVFNSKKEILFFERTTYPYGLTFPAGHLGKDEDPDLAVLRELEEEAGIKLNKAILFKQEMITDKCRKGADFHRWHLYSSKIKNIPTIKTDRQEGKNPVWLTLDQALIKKLTPTVKYFLEKYQKKIGE